MKKAFKRALAVLLAGIIAAAGLAVGAVAAPGDSFDEAIEVTGNFTVNSVKGNSVYYKFVPPQTGYYRICSVSVGGNPEMSVRDNVDDYGSHYSPDADKDRNFGLWTPLTAGEAFFFSVWNGFTKPNITFNVKIEFCGALTDVNVVSYPAKDQYIMGIDCRSDDGHWYMNLSSFDSWYGFWVDLTFDGGQILTLCNWGVSRFFEAKYGKPVLGLNAISFKLDDQVFFTWDVTIIENPVSSIEIVKLPDKTEYVYGKDAFDPKYNYNTGNYSYDTYVDADGIVVKLNYTDGTSEIVPFAECDDWGDWRFMPAIYHGYWFRLDCYTCEIGENDVIISYLGKTATFQIEVVAPPVNPPVNENEPTCFQHILLWLADVAAFFGDLSIWYGLSWLFTRLAGKI